MIDWTEPMAQTFEYYTVDPATWKEIARLTTVTGCTITRDSDTETLGSASFTVTEPLDECYIRAYLISTQKGTAERFPLGTFLVQTPSSDFDGKVSSVTLDGYTPLLELKEKLPPLGFSIFQRDSVPVLRRAGQLAAENLRAPVVSSDDGAQLETDFVANTDDTWLTFLTDYIGAAGYTFDLDGLGQVLFAPKQETAALQPVWTYDDGNSSILYPTLRLERDLYSIPNVVEILCSDDAGAHCARAVNDDSDSPVSTVNRGREIVHRVTDPAITGAITDASLTDYARSLLRELSTLEYTVSYSHGYCPVRVGDCVRLRYSRAGLAGVNAKVVRQTIECRPGCPVSETAVLTQHL